MREDIRLLGTILGDTVREQNGDEVFDLVERARIASFRVRRSEIERAEVARAVRRHRHPPGDPGHPRVQPLRAAGQRRRRHPPRTAPRHPRRRRRPAAGQHPGRHLSEARRSGPGRGDRRRGADRRAGLPGHHRPSDRDPSPDGLRHPAPHHPADAAARAWAHRNRRRRQHRDRVAPPGADAVADRAGSAVAAADLRRDRGRLAVLPGGVLRRGAESQRRGPRRVAQPLARRRPARPNPSCGPARGSAATATATRTSPPTWCDWPPAARPTPRWVATPPS